MEDDKGYVILFPENMPDWALGPDERRKRLRIVEAERDDETEDAADDD